MHYRNHRGMTLIELLVVVSILVLLSALVVSTAPDLETRRLREAARGVNTFLAAAKARAIAKGRPVGVTIVPAPSNARAGLTLFHAEVPDDYSGDLYDYNYDCNMYLQATSPTTVNGGLHIALGLAPILGQGDRIQFGGKGFVYKIESIDSTGKDLKLTVDTRGAPLPWPTAPGWSSPVPFRILRSPIVFDSVTNKVGKASGSTDSYQMPEGTAIDLTGSAFPGANVNIPTAPDNTPSIITIVFSPSGRVSSIYANQGVRYIPSSTILLLIGKLKNVQATASVPPLLNWYDTTNLYVSIGHATGQVRTAELAPVSGASNRQQEIWQASALTRDNFETGGR